MSADHKDGPAVLAFLQNVWVKDPERLRRWFAEKGEDYRLKMLARLLFMVGLTGRRLRHAFGDDLCRTIVWEECSREIGGHAASVFPADMGHIRAALELHRPAVVLTFGVVAATALASLAVGAAWKHIPLPHPAARQAGTVAKLAAGASLLREALKGHLAGGER
jgi:hypothetical protein